MGRTQRNQIKDDAFYSSRSVPTTGNTTRVENNNIVTTKVDNLYAHVVADCNVTQYGIQTIDGYKVKDNDIVLCARQTLETTNGILRVNGAGAWTFTDDEIHAGLSCAITFGTKNAGSIWVCQAPVIPTSQVGTFVESWVKYGEREKSIGLLWKMTRRLVKATLDKILCLIEEIRPHEVVMHYYGFDDRYGGLRNTFIPVPFELKLYEPTEGTVTIGSVGGVNGWYYTPAIDGYWDVDIFIEDEIDDPAGVRFIFYIESLSGIVRDWVKVCSITTGAGINFEVQGSRKIWCAAGGKIFVTMTHNYNVAPYMLYLNDAALDRNGTGYVSIHFAGKSPAATR